MTDTSQNWLELYENAFDSTICTQLISFYDNSANKTFTGTGASSAKSNNRRGQVVTLESENAGPLFNSVQLTLKQCYKKYTDKFEVLKKQQVGLETIGIYKYKDDTEFYGWHTDAADPGLRYRFVSIVAYLNNVESGGETEFMYLNKKIKPKEGGILFFPSSWTHYHQALPPTSGSKYVLVSWLRYSNPPPL